MLQKEGEKYQKYFHGSRGEIYSNPGNAFLHSANEIRFFPPKTLTPIELKLCARQRIDRKHLEPFQLNIHKGQLRESL